MITIEETIIIPHDEPSAGKLVKLLEEEPMWFQNEDTTAKYFKRTIWFELEKEND